MLNVKLAGDDLNGKCLHLDVAGDVFNSILFCAVLFFLRDAWMRSETELSQFLINFLPTIS